jgi:integrase
MGRPKERLSTKEVTKAKSEAPKLWADGGGLYLRTCGNSKSFLFRYEQASKRHDIGLGPFPEIDLATARERAFEFRKMLARGLDPFEQRATVVPRATAPLLASTATVVLPAKGNTFADAVRGFLKGHDKDWSRVHWKQWTTSIERFVMPSLGTMPVADITTADVAEVLRPIWKSKAETASRVRGRIENVLDYAKANAKEWHTRENAAAWKGIKHILGNGRSRSKAKHFESVPVADIPAFYARLCKLTNTTAKALQLLTLTATRTGDVRGADWSEIDLGKRLWTIPASRMKTGSEHVVPLADAAVKLLQSMKPAASGLVFVGERNGGMLGGNQINKLMATLDVNGATPHGLRGSFRMWCAENHVARELAEACLAHKVGSAVEQSYQKSKLTEQRRKIMSAWAIYCGK